MTQARRPRGRPPVSSREKVEAVAIGLFLERGYTETSLAEIITACGVSKTTFFRYFGSKSEIIWYAFDAHTRHLRQLLAEADAREPVMTVVSSCVVEALHSSVDERGIWLKRFIVFDNSAELRAEGLVQWISWADAVSEHVASRLGVSERDLVPASIGGAVQAAFLAALRSWQTSTKPPSELLRDLAADLAPLCDVLQEWLDRR